MSYQVLARKWRPHRFEDMVGQEHVLSALTNALDNDRLHHAYMFTGTRGVGKTTIARILAKSLNCEKGVSSTPCGECATCRDIDAGRFFDLIEVDAASRTKVEQTRELLENVAYAPSARYKVYLIDEVHMFSDHSFNALLKTLEEPPPHVKFLLATTDPQKVPVTVLSRCLQFSLKRLPEKQISDYLAELMQRESIEADAAALKHLARAADGSMRDALSLLDQAIAHGEGVVRAASVEQMLGRPSPGRILDLVGTLADGDAPAAIQMVGEFADYSPDYRGLLGEILSVMHQLALTQNVPGAADVVGFDPARIAELARRMSPEDVQLFYQIGLTGRRDLPLAPDMREAFEMVILRMLAFRPVLPGSDVQHAAPAAPQTAQAPVSVPAAQPQPAAAPTPAAAAPAPTPAPAAPPAPAAAEAPPAAAESAPDSAAPEVPPGMPGDVAAQLASLRAKLSDDGGNKRKASQAAPAAAEKKTLENAPVAPQAAPERAATAVPPMPAPAAAAPVSAPEPPPLMSEYEPAVAPPPPSEEESAYAPPAGAQPDVEPAAPAAPQSAPEPEPESAAPAVAAGPASETLTRWTGMVAELGLQGIQQALVNNCQLISYDGQHLVLQLEREYESLMQPGTVRQLQESIDSWAGCAVALDITVAQGPLDTPYRAAQAAEQARLAEARQSIEQDPVVQRLCRDLDAVVQANSIRPVGDAQ
ncbi:DNA polymerase III subunit gamma/tau [Granulosicoccaceae sp. 1_MG-2023]|nr:DNA polymerase III subunit gamma/tau [Granulosicoccaceae sp. 1_MG-2023]